MLSPETGAGASRTPIIVETVQWSQLTHIDDVMPIGEEDYEVLREIQRVVVKHGRQNRFGVCLLHKHFELAPGEIAMEVTDEARRISTVTVQPDPGAAGTIETMWKFGAGTDPANVTKCVARCHYSNGHRQVHSKEGF